MRDLGFEGIVSLSLSDRGMPKRLNLAEDDPRVAAIRVSNPLSQDHSELRTTLLGSLLDAARYNRAHGAERVALYESGRAYLPERPAKAGKGPLAGDFAGVAPAPAYEPHRIACLACGPLYPGGWRADAVDADFFAIKGILEALASQLGVEVAVEAEAEPFLHPGRAASVSVGDVPVGWIGELHPRVCAEWDLDAAAGFELDLAPLIATSPYGEETYEDVITYPAVHQDIAVVVPEEVSAAAVTEAVTGAGGELLRSAEIFDLYRGEQVGEGRKSLALQLEFRAADRTLTDSEVAERRRAITEAIAGIGGSLRE